MHRATGPCSISAYGKVVAGPAAQPALPLYAVLGQIQILVSDDGRDVSIYETLENVLLHELHALLSCQVN